MVGPRLRTEMSSTPPITSPNVQIFSPSQPDSLQNMSDDVETFYREQGQNPSYGILPEDEEALHCYYVSNTSRSNTTLSGPAHIHVDNRGFTPSDLQGLA